MTQKLRHWILVADLVWITVALLIAYGLRYVTIPYGHASRNFLLQHLPAVAVGLLVWAVLYCSMRLDGLRGGWRLPAALSQVFLGLLLFMVILLAVAFLAKQYYSRLVLFYFACLLLLGLTAIRCVVHSLLHSRYRAGASRRVVILGNGHLAQEIAAKIARHPEMMWEVAGFLYPSGPEFPPNGAAAFASSVPTLGVRDLLRAQDVHELIAVMPLPASSETQKLIGDCRKAGIRVCLVPQWYQLYLSRTRLIEIDSLPLLSLEDHTPDTAARAMQRIMDLVFGSFFLLLSLPFFGLTAAALYLGKGQAFKKELRCGREGKSFWMYRLNIDRDDPALVGYERLLAQLSLTELPQLWNVLRGEMSLVGPRPESFERAKHYSDWQKQRLRVPPGLTGLAQVHGLRERHSSEEKARFDLEYIYHWSLFLDLSLLLQTAWTLAIRLWHPKPAAPQAPLPSTPTHVAAVSEVVHADSTQSSAD